MYSDSKAWGYHLKGLLIKFIFLFTSFPLYFVHVTQITLQFCFSYFSKMKFTKPMVKYLNTLINEGLYHGVIVQKNTNRYNEIEIIFLKIDAFHKP